MNKIESLNSGHRLGMRRVTISSSRGGWLILKFKTVFNVCVSVKDFKVEEPVKASVVLLGLCS